ncbi:unnamed protein product [Peronospora belbahrii]|uniref:Uncharacterized protein n=1 Tax=Peronospora belbahrii TaxID=622444 RepID=A0AAU9L7L8_9STRA|nr:unnamed protein product [Peronospora belbahrii]
MQFERPKKDQAPKTPVWTALIVTVTYGVLPHVYGDGEGPTAKDPEGPTHQRGRSAPTLDQGPWTSHSVGNPKCKMRPLWFQEVWRLGLLEEADLRSLWQEGPSIRSLPISMSRLWRNPRGWEVPDGRVL